MSIYEKRMGQRAGQFGIVLGLHALFAVGLISLGAGGVIEKVLTPPVQIYPPEPVAPEHKQTPLETRFDPIEPKFPRPVIETTVIPSTTKTITATQGDLVTQLGSGDTIAVSIDTGTAVEPSSVTAEPVMHTASLDKRYADQFQPPYPASAQRAEVQGTVAVRVQIGTDGKVLTAAVESSSGSSVLDDAAIRHALKKWRFTPATRDGVAIVSTKLINVVFQLKTTG